MNEVKPIWINTDNYNLIEDEEREKELEESYSDLDNLTVYQDSLYSVYYTE